MTVWIVFKIDYHGTDRFVDVFESEESAKKWIDRLPPIAVLTHYAEPVSVRKD